MSPQSNDHSQYSSAFGPQNSSDRHREDNLNKSLDATRSAKRRADQFEAAPNQKLMPGAQMLESNLSQKQFIIKKQKSKRGQSKGSSLMKAYFPNLIAKKDVTLITPTNV